jgi:hypothetical protein
MAKVSLQKVNGSSYSVPPNVSGSGASNGSGTVTRGGSIASNLTDVAVTRYDAGVFGSAVIDNLVVDKAVSANVLAKNSRTPVAPKITPLMVGTAGTPSLIRTPLSKTVYRTVATSTAFRNGQFNLYTGKYDPAPLSSVDTVATDNAAVLSRSMPGKLVFTKGGVPVSANYKAKTN